MKSFHSYKLNKRTQLLAAAVLAAAYLVGFAAKVYSPAHIGSYAIPIPVLIRSSPAASTSTSTQVTLTSAAAQAAAAFSGASPSGNGAASPPAVFNHLDISTTYFWVGEPADGDNGNIANSASTWDEQWKVHYGGTDSPSPRSGYNPAGFTPKQNPFYFALPYSDIDSQGKRKTTAVNCPLASQKTAYSWCKNGWLAIRHNGKIAYAQWEDAGPFGEDDTAYVFGSAKPHSSKNSNAGLDVSPAVRDYLGLSDVDKADWVFVTASQVPNGPWKTIITTDPGD